MIKRLGRWVWRISHQLLLQCRCFVVWPYHAFVRAWQREHPLLVKNEMHGIKKWLMRQAPIMNNNWQWLLTTQSELTQYQTIFRSYRTELTTNGATLLVISNQLCLVITAADALRLDQRYYWRFWLKSWQRMSKQKPQAALSLIRQADQIKEIPAWLLQLTPNIIIVTSALWPETKALTSHCDSATEWAQYFLSKQVARGWLVDPQQPVAMVRSRLNELTDIAGLIYQIKVRGQLAITCLSMNPEGVLDHLASFQSTHHPIQKSSYLSLVLALWIIALVTGIAFLAVNYYGAWQDVLYAESLVSQEKLAPQPFWQPAGHILWVPGASGLHADLKAYQGRLLARLYCQKLVGTLQAYSTGNPLFALYRALLFSSIAKKIPFKAPADFLVAWHQAYPSMSLSHLVQVTRVCQQYASFSTRTSVEDGTLMDQTLSQVLYQLWFYQRDRQVIYANENLTVNEVFANESLQNIPVWATSEGYRLFNQRFSVLYQLIKRYRLVLSNNWQLSLQHQLRHSLYQAVFNLYQGAVIAYWDKALLNVSLKKPLSIESQAIQLNQLTTTPSILWQQLRLLSQLIGLNHPRRIPLIAAHFAGIVTLLVKSAHWRQETQHSLNALYKALATLQLAMNPAAAIFKATTSIMDNQQPQSISQLNQLIAITPSPLCWWLESLRQHLIGLYLASSEKTIESAWKASILPIYQQAVAGRYPQVPLSGKFIGLTHFKALFQKGGVIDRFYQQYLAGFLILTPTGQLSFNKAYGLPLRLPSEMVAILKQALRWQRAYFSHGSLQVSWTFLPKVILGGEIVVDYNHHLTRLTPGKPTTWQWPAKFATGSIQCQSHWFHHVGFTQSWPNRWGWLAWLHQRSDWQQGNYYVVSGQVGKCFVAGKLQFNKVINPFMDKEGS